jgi:hypothetical protein
MTELGQQDSDLKLNDNVNAGVLKASPEKNNETKGYTIDNELR